MWNLLKVSQGFHMVFRTLFHIKCEIPCENNVKTLWNGLRLFTWYFTVSYVKYHVKTTGMWKRNIKGRLTYLWKWMWKLLLSEIPCEMQCENPTGCVKDLEKHGWNTMWNTMWNFNISCLKSYNICVVNAALLLTEDQPLVCSSSTLFLPCATMQSRDTRT